MQATVARQAIAVGESSSARVLLAAIGVIGFAALTALGAAVRIPLPFTPVPMTLQTLFVLLAGITLGARLGAASMAFYLLLGTAGCHVFAGGEGWGLRTVFGATGGYLLGFVVAQPLLGLLARRHGGSRRALLLSTLAGTMVVYVCGVSWLAFWLHVGWSDALELGLYPFLAGEALKAMAAIGLGHLIVQRTRRWR